MIVRPLHALLLGSLVFPLAFATASLAQDHPQDHPMPPPGGPEADHDGHQHAWRDPAARAAAMAKHLQREAVRLRDALQLRADQEPALRTFLDAMKPPADAMEHMRKAHEEGEALTTPQRLDRMLAKLDEHRAHLVAHAEAVKRFYAQLSPAQQKAFDAVGPQMHGHHGMGGMGHGPMGMGGQMGGPMGGRGMDDEMDGPEGGPASHG